jgi:hypothetical protein
MPAEKSEPAPIGHHPQKFELASRRLRTIYLRIYAKYGFGVGIACLRIYAKFCMMLIEEMPLSYAAD